MMHTNRVWSVSNVLSPEDLAHKLTNTTWCCCTGFRIGDYLWLNDATSPDGAQEYAVVKLVCGEGIATQVESITFSWCSEADALRHIQRTLSGGDDRNDFARRVSPNLQTQAEHGRCHHCA